MASLMAVRLGRRDGGFLDPARYPEDVPVAEEFRKVTGGLLGRVNPHALTTFKFGTPEVHHTAYWGFELTPGLATMLFDLMPGQSLGDVAVRPESVAALAEALKTRPWTSWTGEKYGVTAGLYGQLGRFMAVAREHGLGLAVSYVTGRPLFSLI